LPHPIYYQYIQYELGKAFFTTTAPKNAQACMP